MTSIVLQLGLADTRLALERWNRRPLRALAPWAAVAAAVSLLLLAATGAVASLRGGAGPAPSFPGVDQEPTLAGALGIFRANLLALALHASACVAAFMAGSSLRIAAGRTRARLALAFVVLATCFALVGQAWRLGGGAAALAAELGTSPWLLLAGLLPHALPELTAIFLPFAAWTLAARRSRWHELGAAALVTVGLAVPVLGVCALVETYVTSSVLLRLT